jgi:hypothetical protein
MQEIQIEDNDVNRILELETEVNQTKIALGELELQKIDQIEMFKSKLTEKLNFIGKLKKKYGFADDNFTIDVEKKIIKIK